MKAGFYGRQSVLCTRDDERRDLYTSTDWQVIDGHAWVRRQGGEIVRTYRDEGISGYTGALRPEFERLLIDVDDRVIDTVVCWKLDRLARNHRDFERLWDTCGRRGARLVSLQETFDSSTPAGEFTIRMLAGMAKMESDNISVRVKRALEAFRQAGRMHTGGARPSVTAGTAAWSRTRPRPCGGRPSSSLLAAASTLSPVSWPPMAWSAPRASRWGAGWSSAWRPHPGSRAWSSTRAKSWGRAPGSRSLTGQPGSRSGRSSSTRPEGPRWAARPSI